jgi:hypothetical protein
VSPRLIPIPDTPTRFLQIAAVLDAFRDHCVVSGDGWPTLEEELSWREALAEIGAGGDG